MADTNTPIAPSPAPTEPSVANQTNSNPAPAPAEAPAEPTITAEQVAKFFGTTPEAITKSKTFADNNGGYDKVFADRKQEITDPTKKAEAAPQVEAQPVTQQAEAKVPEVQKPAQNAKLPDGMASLEELALQQYFETLSQKKEYANIADEIKDGSFLKAMQEMGMNPIDANKNINIKQVNQYLGMYSKTKPQITPSTPMEGTGSAPTKGYTEIPDGKFASMAQAQEVATHRDHPQYKQALEYIRGQLNPQKNAGQIPQA